MELGVLHSIIGEVWKPVEGFPNYAVSNRGRVYSFTREEVCNGHIRMRQGRILIPRLGKQGYYYVTLRKNGKTFTKSIHRIVALTFLPHKGDLTFVNHRDENRLNNDVENLEWCTFLYNTNYGTSRDRRIKTLKKVGFCKRVQQLTLDGKVVATYGSIKEAEKLFSNKGCNICNCCKGKSASAYGYRWRYAV